MDWSFPLSYIYIEEVERKGLGRGMGLQLPAESFLENFHSFFKITVCYILTPDEQFSYHNISYK
jgi:hypothetical protein